MKLVFACLAGLLTLINPCVLPIVLASSLHRDCRAPMALAAGPSLSFVVSGLRVTSIGPALGIDSGIASKVAALVMLVFGLVMLVPAFSEQFASATAGLAARADAQSDQTTASGSGGQFVSGGLLGPVWSPCIGPTLGAAIALASTGDSLGRAGAIMLAFAPGVLPLILGLAYGAESVLRRRQTGLRALAEWSKHPMGVVFVLVGTALWLPLHHFAEAWLIDLSASF